MLFYRGKHYKKNPRIEQIKSIPRQIKNECINILKWWVSLKDRVPQHGARLLDYHDAFWDNLEDCAINTFYKTRKKLKI